MLELADQTVVNCSGLSRRAMLRAGVLGLSGLTLADALRVQAATPARSTPSDRSVILIWLDGGPPQHETYDPKPAAPSDFRGPLKAIDTKVPGIQFSELFPLQAKLADRISVLRSVNHGTGDHFAAAHWMLTGYLGSTASNLAPMYPSAGSIITKMLGARSSSMPAYVGLPNTHSVGIAPGYHGGAYLGASFNPFNAPGDPNQRGYKQDALTLPTNVTNDRMDGRRGLLASFEDARRAVDGQAASADLDKFQAQAFSLLTSPEARRAFDIEREDPRLRDRYGRNRWGQSALIGRRLVEAGVRFVTLTFDGWDFHSSLEKGMHRVLPMLDAAVAGLVEDLSLRGLLDSTMVVVMGEFGRTPKINKGLPQDPIPGRDHWGRVMSVMMAGGGLRGGLTVGSSSPNGETPRDRPIKPADILTTIYRQLGLDPEHVFHDRAGRPITIGGVGAPIDELV